MAQSLKIIRLEPRLSRIIIIAAALVCVTASWFSIRWHFANAVAPTFERQRPESPLIANWLTEVAPSDPLTHYFAAVVFEKTFDVGDLDRSLLEYELATAASPNNYLMWLSLGKARNLSGDTAGAEAAFKRALALAPNYAAVQWAYGNFLIRQDKTDEGFVFMTKASATNPEYARSAAVTALEIFEGDVSLAERALGQSDATNAALQTALVTANRPEDAFNAWSRISDDAKSAKYRISTEKFASDLIAAKKFGLAARVAAALGGEPAVQGQIGNGGFESGVKLRNAGLFEWQVAEGGSPQVGLNESQTHGGKYNLVVIFNSFETAAFRTISQTVVVVPGAPYELRGFYRSEVKMSATLRWEIADGTTTATIEKTEPLMPASGWTQFAVKFTAPANGDGVIIRFNREGCSGASCPTNGTISFDDLSLSRL